MNGNQKGWIQCGAISHRVKAQPEKPLGKAKQTLEKVRLPEGYAAEVYTLYGVEHIRIRRTDGIRLQIGDVSEGGTVKYRSGIRHWHDESIVNMIDKAFHEAQS